MKKILMGLALSTMLMGCPVSIAPTDAPSSSDANVDNRCGADMCASTPGAICCDTEPDGRRRECLLPEMCIPCIAGGGTTDTRRDVSVGGDAGCFAR